MPQTPNLGIPYVQANQSAKETTINDAFLRIEQALSSSLAVNLAPGNATITLVDFQADFNFTLSGQTSSRDLIVPNIKKLFMVTNDGPFNAIVKTSSAGQTCTVQPAEKSLIWLDGNNNAQLIATNLAAISATNLLALTDTPDAYSGQAAKVLTVRSDETGVEFTTLSTGTYIPVSEKGAVNGVASLDGTGRVPSGQLPSYVDDVLEFANLAAFPGTGETAKLYVDMAQNKIYRWTGTIYVVIEGSPGTTDAVPEGATNLYFTADRVRSTVLTGLSTASSVVIAATDSVLQALGKLQAQISALPSVAAATVAEFRAATAGKYLTTDSVWGAGAEVPLTDDPTIAVDLATFINASVTLAGNRALGAPSNVKAGQTGHIRVIQDGTGSRTLSFATGYVFEGGVPPVMSTAANSIDLLMYKVLLSGSTLISALKAVS
jgi:hypothetical protein